MVLLLLGIPDAFCALHLLCDFEVALADASLIQIRVHFLVFTLLLDQSYLYFFLLVVVDLRPVLFFQLQLVQLLPLLHFLQLLPSRRQVLLYLQLLVSQQLRQFFTSGGRFILPFRWRFLPLFLGLLLAPLQILFLVFLDGLHIVPPMKIPYFF